MSQPSLKVNLPRRSGDLQLAVEPIGPAEETEEDEYEEEEEEEVDDDDDNDEGSSTGDGDEN